MADVTLRWQLPTTRQQGGPLLPEDVQLTRVEMSADGGANYTPINDVAPDVVQQVTVPELEFGTWLFRIATYALDAGRGEEHVESVDIADTSPPAAVQNVTVEITP